ncbi:hypothetical protein DL96DRAFT_1774332 [Flagelloscypha sp. PMI_526]|nr:hypothetical protein DL96DRAFT_1774332 [Flagelloscypha sp. PMI_526]
MNATSLSIQEVAEKFNDISDVAYLYNLDTFVISLCFGPVLILSIIALANLGSREPTTPPLKRLRFVILIQTVFVTLRFSCQLGENIVAFKQRRLLLITDNGVEKINNSLVATSRIGMVTIGDFSARVVEALANGVVVWRAWSLYSGVLWIKYLLITAWICDLAVGMVFFGVSVMINFRFLSRGDTQHIILAYIVMYSSRWTSFALNLMATVLIAYRTWKLKGTLNDAGLIPNRSSVYMVLFRLVETGVILLAVQLLIAVLAVTYTSGDPANPGYLASTLVGDTAFTIINAHPAGMALVSNNVWARERRVPGDREANDRTMSIAFKASCTLADQSSLDSPES